MPPNPPNKKTRLLVILGIVVLAGILWYLVSLRSGEIPGPAAEKAASRRLAIPEINFSVLDSEVLQKFKSWSPVPLQSVPTGKTNPFSR